MTADIQISSPGKYVKPMRARRDEIDPARLRFFLDVDDDSPSALAASLPFTTGDCTAGAENEFQAVVVGEADAVDLPITIRESNYHKNLIRRAESGDVPQTLLSAFERYLNFNADKVWENSWVSFPVSSINPYAQQVFENDLYADKRVRDRKRSDVARFFHSSGGREQIRIPISYLLKLSLADAIGPPARAHALIAQSGEQLMRHFLNDNTSPETFSFHPIRLSRENGMGAALARETLKRFLMVHLLTEYANSKFDLRAGGQTALVYFAPHTPSRQKLVNEIVPDSFYRDLFMSPCLSGWDQGEAKYQYMILCHEVLSRSRLNTIAKLKESGVLANNLVTLPNISNTSLANNGTHVSLGSRKLTALLKSGEPGFTPAAEKNVGDLVIKIVEHFLPLFVGAYSAAPWRIDFTDFHPETVLGFLPHELDFTHLRMLWRRWKHKADLKFCGRPITPLGPRRLDRLIARIFGLRGDWVPDQRLIDYLVCPMSTDESPALDGTIGNDVRLKRDLAEMGVFDMRMPLYALYRHRSFSSFGFCGFEGRHYSQFSGMRDDFAEAVSLQALVTALAYQYVLQGRVSHADIPDTPQTESERRQIFFGAAIGLPTFFVDPNLSNRFMARILERATRSRPSHRYQGRIRLYHVEYRRALILMLREDAAGLIEAMGLSDTIERLEERVRANSPASALSRLMDGILREAGATDPLRVSAEEFNRASERYYRNTLRRRYLDEAIEVLGTDFLDLDRRAATQRDDISDAVLSTLGGQDAIGFLRANRGALLAGNASVDVFQKMIHLLLIVVHRDRERHLGS
jgi:hypothetical protein